MNDEHYGWRRAIDIIAIASFTVLSFGALVGGDAFMCLLCYGAILFFALSMDADREKHEKAMREKEEKEKRVAKFYAENDKIIERHRKTMEEVADIHRKTARTLKEAYTLMYGQDFLDYYNSHHGDDTEEK